MDDSGARTKGERGSLEPASRRRTGQFLTHTRSLHFLRGKRQVVADTNRAPHKIHLTAERAGRDIERVVKDEAAWRDERAFPQIECLSETERADEVGCRAEEHGRDVGGSHLDVSARRIPDRADIVS